MPVKKRSRAKSKPTGLLPKILIIAGIMILVAVVFLLKNQPVKTEVPVTESPEAKLNRYMEEGKPVFAFFHSTNCQSCIDMMGIVDQVYPEFQTDVAIVDVNVYDPQNENLLRKAGINTIPTQVFINRKGEGQVVTGVMEADVFRQKLTALKETP